VTPGIDDLAGAVTVETVLDRTVERRTGGNRSLHDVVDVVDVDVERHR
jgi:hypothetical protein